LQRRCQAQCCGSSEPRASLAVKICDSAVADLDGTIGRWLSTGGSTKLTAAVPKIRAGGTNGTGSRWSAPFTKEPNMKTPTRTALCALFVLPLTACDPQTDGAYQGEPLIALTGTVQSENLEPPAGVELVVAYFVYNKYKTDSY
jgi:hypothetical protein